MKRLFLLPSFALVLGGCVTPGGIPTEDCEGTTNGPAEITFTYRLDSKMNMDIRVQKNVKTNSQFEIKLKTLGSSSNDVLVKTTGVSGTLPGGGTTDFTWLNKSGSYNSTAGDSHKLIFCVPAVPEDTWYKFDISIEDGGTTYGTVFGVIDPRLDVTN